MNDTKTSTTIVYVTSWLRVGQMTLRSSATTSRRKRTNRPAASPCPAGRRHGRRYPGARVGGVRRRVRPPGPAVRGGPWALPPRFRLALLAHADPLADPAVLTPIPTYCARPMQGRQDLNLQPAVLETAALPIELHPLAGSAARRARVHGPAAHVPQESVRHRTALLSGATSRGRPDAPRHAAATRWGRMPAMGTAAPPSPRNRTSGSDLRTHRRHRRVGDAGGRRQGQALKAAGRPVIGFGAGEPDFPTPGPIVAAAQAASRTRRTTATPPPPACPNCGRPSRRRRSATAVSSSPPARC